MTTDSLADTVSLAGQVCIVTGGASGIGRATGMALAKGGAHVVVVDVNQSNIAAAMDELAAGASGESRHLGLQLSVADELAMAQMAQQTLERFGRIDTLIACAGVLRGVGSYPKPLHKVSVEEWDHVLGINLRGLFLSNRAVLPAMLAQRRGNIINLSSVSGLQGRAHDGPYSASKFGVIGMSQALAEEVRRHGVRVQVVIPDAVRTAIWEQNGPIPCPEDALPPERVAELIQSMVTLPWDTVLGGVVIAPFKTRKRRPQPTAREDTKAEER
jgi:NAD(P)-dependent dehydrogenase (short-subunit alcohol dehydrogenase family)